MLLDFPATVRSINFTGILPRNLHVFNGSSFDLVYLFLLITLLLYKVRVLFNFVGFNRFGTLRRFRSLLVKPFEALLFQHMLIILDSRGTSHF